MMTSRTLLGLLLTTLLGYVTAQNIKPQTIYIRLINGPNEFSGTVQVRSSHTEDWGTVCDDSFNNAAASVICRMLGHKFGISKVGGEYKEGTGKILMDDVQCKGSETSLGDCEYNGWGVNNCRHTEDAGVLCTNNSATLIARDVSMSDPELSYGTVFLRTAVGLNPVCDVGWDDDEAGVLCKSLGFVSGRAQCCSKLSLPAVVFRHESTSITNMSCLGSETSISDCPYTTTPNCDVERQASVICYKTTLDKVDTKLKVQWVEANTMNGGPVKIFWNGLWGQSCYDNWDDKAANVTCRMLGFKYGVSHGSALTVLKKLAFWITSINCTGTEMTLDKCNITWGKATKSRACRGTNRVLCYNDIADSPTVKLSNGSFGLVQVTFKGQTGTICDPEWTNNDAKTVCKQLGYDDGAAVKGSYYGKGTGPVYMSKSICYSADKTIWACKGANWTQVDKQCLNHDTDASVICHKENIKLVAGDHSHGIVLVKTDPRMSWSEMCGHGFTNREATVVCRDMGFKHGYAFPHGAYGVLYYSYYSGRYTCRGNESTIFDCKYEDSICYSRTRTEYASVGCYNGTLSNKTSILLKDGEPLYADMNGRVMVHRYNISGKVCASGWTDTEASVVCKQMGFGGGMAYQLNGIVGGPFLRVNVNCSGNESSILDCRHADTYCKSGYDAGVLCYKTRKTEVHLIDGTKTSGVLEIVHDGERGAVCSSSDKDLATVTCKHLGFNDGEFRNISKKTGLLTFMRNYRCYGREATIFQCINYAWRKEDSRPCDYLEVNCFNNVKLMGGMTNATMTSGQVLVYVRGRWKPVCRTGFDEFEASLACSDLGYPYYQLVTGSAFSIYYYGTSYIYKCKKTEKSILDCENKTALFSCSSREARAALVCSKYPLSKDVTFKINKIFPSEVNATVYGLQAKFCRDSWTDNEASVVCKEMGFSKGIAFGATTSLYLRFSVWLNISCTGDESSVNDCVIDKSFKVKCESNYPPGVFCLNPDNTGFKISLENANQVNPTSGRVIVTYNGQKGVVCDSVWTDRDASVVCRQLGFSDGKASLKFGAGTGMAWVSYPRCSGTETSLWGCPTGDFNSTSSKCTSHTSDVGVVCSGKVRLSQSETHGAIQVKIDKYNYVLVCDDEFDDTDASVVCKELGYQYGIKFCCSAFGRQRYPIGITDVKCTGNEITVTECPHKLTLATCPSNQYASVVCSNTGSNAGYDVKINNTYYGVITVKYMGKWGYICANNFTDKDADVICREQGYLGGSAFTEYKYDDHRLRWLGNMRCSGSELNLARCPGGIFGHVKQCTVLGDAAVVCYKDKSLDVQYRLDNMKGLTGTIKVSVGGVWGSVCNDYSFDDSDANVLCKMTGKYTGGKTATGSPSDNRPITLSQMKCPKGADTIRSCPLLLKGQCRSSRTSMAAVTCYSTVRLYGSSSSYGQAQMHINNEWLKICDKNVDDNGAKVICKQMGFAYGKAQCCSAIGDVKNTANTTVTMNKCTGSEKDFQSCGYTINAKCSPDQYVTLYCSNSAIVETAIEVKMETSKSMHGAILAKRVGFWGPVCNKGWQDEAANVACKQMKWAGGVASYAKTANREAMVVGNIQCTGKEANVGQCKFNDFGATTGCSYAIDSSRRAAGVICYNSGINIKLTGGNQKTYGFVELEFDNQKGKVCNRYFYTDEAKVLCRQLGFKSGKTSQIISSSRATYTKVWMNYINCQGNETSIFQCSHRWYSSYKSYCTSVQVQCYNELYLGGGSYSNGVINYSPYGVWGTICAAGWTKQNTQVACRDLGFAYGQQICCGAVVDSTAPIAVNVQCTGNEKQLTECSFQHRTTEVCDVDKAAVACYNSTPSTKFTWTLDGGNNYTGGIIITHMGVKGRVCPDGWDDIDAKVACREQGYMNGTTYIHYHNTRRNTKGPLWTSNINCKGDESALADCAMDTLGEVKTCSSPHTAGLLCYNTEGVFYRLVGKQENKGRVEISVDGVWGTVCDTYFDFTTANVLCKSLGFEEGELETASSIHDLEPPPKRVYAGKFQCTGRESSLSECPHDGWYPTTSYFCKYHYSDAAVSCYGKLKLGLKYDVTLTNGPVRYYYNDVWHPVCDIGFTDMSAKRVCQDLGFPDGKALCCSAYGNLLSYHEYTSIPQYSTNISMVCSGGEKSIEQCIKKGSCKSNEYASVVCVNATGLKESYSFNLKTKKQAGIVMVNHYGVSGRICSNLWNDTDARVFCKNHNYNDGIAYAHDLAASKPTFSEPFWLSNVTCTGQEPSLRNCSFKDRMSLGNCSLADAASAICFNGDQSIEYRMVGGSNYGRVEVSVGGVWGTICDKYWDDREAGVFCRQKGFDDGYAIPKAGYGRGKGPVWLSHLACTGSEPNLHKCPHKGFNDAIVGDWDFFPSDCETHRDDASVFCIKSLRLNLGINASQGAVEIYSNNRWTAVCADGFNANSAKVVCTQLKYKTGIDVGNSNFGNISAPIGISKLECSGTEIDIDQCIKTKSTICPSNNYASVVCLNESVVPAGFKIKLIPDDSTQPFYGRLEVEIKGVRGSVCNKGFGENEATVACKNVGYTGGGVPMDTMFDIKEYLTGGSLLRLNEPPILMTNVKCAGNERNLNRCQWSQTSATGCSYKNKRAGVLCYNGTAGVQYRVGSGSGIGAVEIKVNNQWGPICDVMNGDKNAMVACKSAGYKSGMSIPSTPYLEKYSGSSVKMLFYYIYCYGMETMLTECVNDGYNRTYTSQNYEKKCDNGALMTVKCFKSELAITKVRLVDGGAKNQGRVEVFLQGPDEWGTVCDDLWDDTDATIVCKQLGYTAGGKAVKSAFFSRGKGAIWLDDVNCVGNESRLAQCPHAGLKQTNCDHSEDAGVICEGPKMTTITTYKTTPPTTHTTPPTTPTTRKATPTAKPTKPTTRRWTPRPVTSKTTTIATGIPGQHAHASSSVDESVLIPAITVPIVLILLILACVVVLLRKRNVNMDDTSSLVSGISSSNRGSVVLHKNGAAYSTGFSPEVRDNEDNNAFTNPMYENAIDEVKLEHATITVPSEDQAEEQV